MESLYYSVLVIGVNEMGPVTVLECFSASMLLVGSLFINANLFSELALLIATMGRKQSIY